MGTIYQHPVARSYYDSDDPFGNMRPTGSRHLGSDYACGVGTTVRAVSDGIVVVAQWSTVLGFVLGQSVEDGEKFVGYAHLSEFGPNGVGSFVRRGDIIGYSGNTGTASLGPHLHISLGGTSGAIFGERPLLDPFAYIDAHTSSTGSAGLGVTLIDETQPPLLEFGDNVQTRVITQNGIPEDTDIQGLLVAGEFSCTEYPYLPEAKASPTIIAEQGLWEYGRNSIRISRADAELAKKNADERFNARFGSVSEK